MKSYEELLSDIEEDMELMGSSHMVYAMEEDSIITDYDNLPINTKIRKQLLSKELSGNF